MECNTPGHRSNVVVFNLIISHKTIILFYPFHSHLLSVLISTNILA